MIDSTAHKRRGPQVLTSIQCMTREAVLDAGDLGCFTQIFLIESVILLRHYQTSRVGATGHELAISYTRLPTPMIQPFKIDDRKMGVLKMLYR